MREGDGIKEEMTPRRGFADLLETRLVGLPLGVRRRDGGRESDEGEGNSDFVEHDGRLQPEEPR